MPVEPEWCRANKGPVSAYGHEFLMWCHVFLCMLCEQHRRAVSGHHAVLEPNDRYA